MFKALRIRRKIVFVISVISLIGVAATVSGQVPFRVGERLSYDVQWRASLVRVSAATITLEVGAPTSSDFEVIGEARLTSTLSNLYSLYYRAESLVDARTLLPREGRVYSEEGSRKRDKLTRINHDERTAEFEMRTSTVWNLNFEVPAGVQDALSAFYLLRAMAWNVGQTFTLPVTDSGKVYTLQVEVDELEPIETGIGTIDAFRSSLQVVEEDQEPTDRRMTIWMSRDARRLPVQVEIDLPVGSFLLVLDDVT